VKKATIATRWQFTVAGLKPRDIYVVVDKPVDVSMGDLVGRVVAHHSGELLEIV
jgi:hypothetical protein